MCRVAANPPADAQSGSEQNARAEAERAGRPFLLYRDGDGKQQLFVFAPGAASASVGRRPSSDLLLDWDDQVSRLHARFERVDDEWELVDDGLSSNGTFVNEERLNGRRRLSDGDTAAVREPTTVTFRRARARAPVAGRSAPAGRAGQLAVSLSTTQRRVLVALCRPYKGAERVREPGHRPADRRGAVPVRRRGEGPSQGAVRQARRRGDRPRPRRESASSSGPSRPA